MTLLKIFVFLALIAFLGAFVLACTSTRPPARSANLVVLPDCPGTPNCVSSQAKTAQHAITPLPGDWNALKQAITNYPRTNIVEERENYLWVEFTMPLIPFVDDVEFLKRPDGKIDVRSASRVGRSDLGVNRRRVEAIREKMGVHD